MTVDVPDQERQALVRKALKILDTGGISLPLGVWSGQGDWVTTSQEYRNQQGKRALAELDARIAQLAEFRAELATAVNA